MMMRAMRFNSTDGVSVVQQCVPVPGPNQALVRVLRAGVCSTDLEITKGYVPGFDSVMGHEFVGRVESCASAPQWVGKTVCGEINFACQTCGVCSRKDDMARNHCPNRTVFGIICQDGCFADYTVMPVANLIEVPLSVTLQEAVFVEPLAAACRIMEQNHVKASDKVAVVGDGKLGLLIARAVLSSGIVDSLTIFGRHSSKMELVDGATRLIASPAAESMYAGTFDVCIDATGSPQGIAFAVSVTKPLGTVVQKSTCSAAGGAPLTVSLINTIVVDEKKLVGSRCGPFDTAMAMLAKPEVKSLLQRMVSSTFPLSHGIEALSQARTKGVLKVLIDMEMA
mmetsp:Transcript_24341/g.62463  ORF Transcript_24341/g.62463 Transcript_24341/m.62463 type:complete len:339 (-) Transcript_24341:516-1532(-)